jgi:hypothetical protein
MTQRGIGDAEVCDAPLRLEVRFPFDCLPAAVRPEFVRQTSLNPSLQCPLPTYLSHARRRSPEPTGRERAERTDRLDPVRAGAL